MGLNILNLVQSIISVNNNKGQNLGFLFPSVLLLYNWNITQDPLLLISGLLGIFSYAATNAAIGVLTRKVKEEEKSINENMMKASEYLTENGDKGSKILKVSFAGVLITMSVSLVAIISTLNILLNPIEQSYFTGIILLGLTILLLVHSFTEAFLSKGYWTFVKEVQKEAPGKNFWTEKDK